MLIVRVELHSAVTGEVSEIARMEIVNDGTGSARVGNYDARVLRGRSRAALDARQVHKTARLDCWPRQRMHVWSLVGVMLAKLGYR